MEGEFDVTKLFFPIVNHAVFRNLIQFGKHLTCWLVCTTLCHFSGNPHSNYTVAAYQAGDVSVIGHLPRELSRWI